MLQLNVDERPLICGVGLRAVTGRRRIWLFIAISVRVVFSEHHFPYENMEENPDRPEEYADIATKCVTAFAKNRDRCLVISRVMTKRWTAATAQPHVWYCGMKDRLTVKYFRRILRQHQSV